MMALRCFMYLMIGERGAFLDPYLTSSSFGDQIFRQMAISLDLIDLELLEALQLDADRTNVELARLVGLSPAATLNRVRRLKQSGVISHIVARLDPTLAGFPLHVYVTVSIQSHDDASHRRFQDAIQGMPEVISADWVSGEIDAILIVVAREIAELQRVLIRLSTRGGAGRVTTMLRLQELKPLSPLPLALSD
jgi:Lrp/AsnC family transcriptional regulator, leucine-responsive regulatory protein